MCGGIIPAGPITYTKTKGTAPKSGKKDEGGFCQVLKGSRMR